jgi:prefoldin subunit 5
LIDATRKASEAYKTCMGSDDSHISLSLLSEGKPKTNEECEAEKEALEKTYIKAYVELSRMKAEYEELANSTSCFDAVNEQYNSRHPALQDAADKLSSQINAKVQQLQELRPRLDGAKESETQLRAQVQKLTAQCKNVGATVSDLDKVRDAIQSLSECPGLARVKFSMPKWVGTWAFFEQDAASSDDAAQDAKMNAACTKLKAGSRAAEVGEIQEQTVEGIPVSNTAPNPLLGACPDCAGDGDEAFSSGHARVCWVAGKMLTLADRSVNCGSGKKAILCVQDRPDVRVIPSGF